MFNRLYLSLIMLCFFFCANCLLLYANMDWEKSDVWKSLLLINNLMIHCNDNSTESFFARYEEQIKY